MNETSRYQGEEIPKHFEIVNRLLRESFGDKFDGGNLVFENYIDLERSFESWIVNHFLYCKFRTNYT